MARERIIVRVAATSANLGPGFDSFGLALDLCNEVKVEVGTGTSVRWEGEGADELPTDGSDLVTRSMHLAAADAGIELPGFSLLGLNRIPLERGMGSSSAATVAGVALGRAFATPDAEPERIVDDTFRLAAAIEGHPDNAAPAVYGGFTIALPDGPALRFDPDPRLRPVLLVPSGVRLPTREARAALTPDVPRSDAVFNAAHAAVTALALTGRPDLLIATLRDRLHQDARLTSVPSVARVFDLVLDAGLPVCVSGAGPSLLAFEGLSEGAGVVPDPGKGWEVLRLPVRTAGLEIIRAPVD
jgi:homoserine kinase